MSTAQRLLDRSKWWTKRKATTVRVINQRTAIQNWSKTKWGMGMGQATYYYHITIWLGESTSSPAMTIRVPAFNSPEPLAPRVRPHPAPFFATSFSAPAPEINGSNEYQQMLWGVPHDLVLKAMVTWGYLAWKPPYDPDKIISSLIHID